MLMLLIKRKTFTVRHNTEQNSLPITIGFQYAVSECYRIKQMNETHTKIQQNIGTTNTH